MARPIATLLALAAGERSRIASQQFINPQQAGDLLHFAFCNCLSTFLTCI